MKQYKKNSALAGAALAAFLIMTGCHHKQAAAPEPPEAPAAETAPRSHRKHHRHSRQPSIQARVPMLNWTTTDATDVSIDGIGQVPTSGTKTVTPTETTTYHLVARGDGGSADATATVTVSQAQAPNTRQDR